MTSPMIRVAVADDHPVLREALLLLLQKAPYLEVVATYESFRAVLQDSPLAGADVLVLDLMGMGFGPITMLRELHRMAPTFPVVVFSSIVDLAPEVLAEGALGYVSKTEMVEHLVRAIRAARAGTTYVSPSIQDYLDRVRGKDALYKITPREIEATKLLANSYRTPLIAELMGIGERGAQNYITSMLKKTGTNDRLELIEWYHRCYVGAGNPKMAQNLCEIT